MEDEEDTAEEEKSDQMPDVFTDVTLAVDHLQLTTSNEKTAKSHGFKVGTRVPKYSTTAYGHLRLLDIRIKELRSRIVKLRLS